MTPCYLAASVGWLAGLQKLVQAGGDLMAARGAGVKNKTALHVAAEHCHAAVVEYIVNETKGALNLEEDSHGKSNKLLFLQGDGCDCQKEKRVLIYKCQVQLCFIMRALLVILI